MVTYITTLEREHKLLNGDDVMITVPVTIEVESTPEKGLQYRVICNSTGNELTQLTKAEINHVEMAICETL